MLQTYHGQCATVVWQSKIHVRGTTSPDMGNFDPCHLLQPLTLQRPNGHGPFLVSILSQ